MQYLALDLIWPSQQISKVSVFWICESLEQYNKDQKFNI